MNIVNLLGVIWDPSHGAWADALEQRVIRHAHHPQNALGSFHTNVPPEPPSGN